MSMTNPSVDGYIRKNSQWKAELEKLRAIVLGAGLVETIKWRTPCYTLGGANLVMISGWKDYSAISFLKGALLRDPRNVLIAPGKNTQSARMIRFTNVQEIIALEATLRAYIDEAIAAEKAGRQVQFKETSEYEMPEELTDKLASDDEFKAAFEALTPGRQRGYILHFSGAKQSATRAARIERCRERIFKGKGWNER